MGTNFYWMIDENGNACDDYKTDERDSNVNVHIGKRSCAGRYCFPCGVALIDGGSRSVHTGKYQTYTKCPNCGLESNTVACSFTYTMMKHRNRINNLAEATPDLVCVVDENGSEFTALKFKEILDGCPIVFQHCANFS